MLAAMAPGAATHVPVTHPQATAVVTGANRGLGRAIVDELLARGLPHLVATARSIDGAADLRSVAARDERVILRELDVVSASSIADFAAAMHADGRPIDVLVNNAGIGPDGRSILALPIAHVRLQIETHAIGPLELVKSVAGLFQPGSVIVNISSVVSGMHRISASYAGYAQAKALQNGFTRALARTFDDRGVIVLALHPGWVSTDMGGPEAPLKPAEVARGMVDLILASTLSDSDTFRDHTGAPAIW